MLLLDGEATWTGVGALAIAALLLALGIVLFMRWRRAASREIAQIQAASGRTEGLLAELTRELGGARAESRRLSALGALASTLDLDAAFERALRAVGELAEADAAMIVLHRDTEPVTATFGLTGEESLRDLIGPPPEAGRARAVKLNYLYTPEEAANDAFRLSGGLAVPLADEGGERVGTLGVFWRHADHAVTDEELARFEELAAAFGPALENARLYAEARRLADTDPLTGLRTPRYFDERLERECARAHRYGRALGLLLFEADEDGTDLERLGQHVRSAVRSADDPCHLGEGRFAVIVPEARLAQVERIERRLQFALGATLDDGEEGLRLYSAVVELRAHEDASRLVQRAEDALAEDRALNTR